MNVPRVPSRGHARWGAAERRTLAIGVVAAGTTVAVFATEIGRVWRRGSAPLPQDADRLLDAAEEAVAETVEVAVAGYGEVSRRENALFNMLASFVATFAITRGITSVLRGRRTAGPFRNLTIGRRHIHHFVPGIVIAFIAGGAGILTRGDHLDPKLALAFGTGMGLTLDESALLLELDDVYWTREGLVSVQITLSVTALLGTLALGLRFLRRGEELVLPSS